MLVTIKDDVPVVKAAKLLLDRHTDLLIVCGNDELVAGVIANDGCGPPDERLPKIGVEFPGFNGDYFGDFVG